MKKIYGKQLVIISEYQKEKYQLNDKPELTIKSLSEIQIHHLMNKIHKKKYIKSSCKDKITKAYALNPRLHG